MHIIYKSSQTVPKLSRCPSGKNGFLNAKRTKWTSLTRCQGWQSGPERPWWPLLLPFLCPADIILHLPCAFLLLGEANLVGMNSSISPSSPKMHPLLYDGLLHTSLPITLFFSPWHGKLYPFLSLRLEEQEPGKMLAALSQVGSLQSI